MKSIAELYDEYQDEIARLRPLVKDLSDQGQLAFEMQLSACHAAFNRLYDAQRLAWLDLRNVLDGEEDSQ